MEKAVILFVILNLWTTGLALQCKVVPGKLIQIDAGNGQVFGVSDNNKIFTLFSGGWVQVPGSLKHVSVGPAGVWGIDSGDNIYKLQGGAWFGVSGSLKQVDAGGSVSPAGVSKHDAVFCLPGGQGGWINIPGKLKYYSCGPYSCWGVNSGDQIYVMKGVTSTDCAGSKNWENIPGGLSMIEVSTDGKVYGASSDGKLYIRDGVSTSAPAGTGWRHIPLWQSVKHVSYDAGHLWIITKDNSIMDCTE